MDGDRDTTRPDPQDSGPESGTYLPVAERIDDDCELRLFVSADGFRAKATLRAGPAAPLPDASEIRAMFRSAGIAAPVEDAAVEALIEGARAGGTLVSDGVEVARGEPPVDPADGYIDFLVHPDTGEASFSQDAHGVIDFHDRSNYDLVTEGQEIGVYHPPAKGVPGVTVTGAPVPFSPRSTTAVRFGRGAVLDPATGKIRATGAGRVLYVSNTVSIEDEYNVKGDVDFEVGNIRSTGFVNVGGDVCDGFSVRGDKGIKVAGIVGAAKLQSDGDITLQGVSGKGKGRIVCGGTLRARFLDEVEVECGGDVVVELEVRGSRVKAGGKILVGNGIVAGGECVALGGIEVRMAGSHLGVRTVFSAGVDFRQRGRLEELKRKIRLIDETLRNIEHSVGPIQPDSKEFEALAPARKEELRKIFGKRESLARDREELLREASGILPENNPGANPMVNVRGKIWENCCIVFGDHTVPVLEEVAGPVSIIRNSRDGSLRFLPMQPLARKAADVERKILEEEEKAQGARS